MNKSPKLSVVIPCFNHGEFLPEAVASVLETDRDDVEIIVIDDGSTDQRTRLEMDALAARGLNVIRQENKGLAAARNAGVGASKGEYIFPLDADDHVRPAFFDHGIRILDANPKLGVVYSDGQFIGTRSGRWVMGAFDPRRLLPDNFIPCCAVFRRVIWEQNGGYDGTMPVQGWEDWDFWLGAVERGWEFAYVPEILFDYRVADTSMITRAQARRSEVEGFVARKHGLFYRQALLQTVEERESLKATLSAERESVAQERESVKFTSRNLQRLLKARLRQKLQRNGG